MAWEDLAGEVAEMFSAAQPRMDDALERWNSWRRARIREKRPAYQRPRSKVTREQRRKYRIAWRLKDKEVIAEIRARHVIAPLPYVGRSQRLASRIRKLIIAKLAKKRRRT